MAAGLTWRIVDGATTRDVSEHIAEESFTHALVGGCQNAELRVDLPPSTFPTLGMQSRLIVSAPTGEPIWEGFISDPGPTYDDDAAYLDMSAVGSMVLASDKLLPLVYTDATLDRWETAPNASTKQRVESADGALTVGFASGNPVGTGDAATVTWARLTHSEQTAAQIRFTVTSGVTTGYEVRVIATTAAGVATTAASWVCTATPTARTVSLPAGTASVSLQHVRTGAATNVATETVQSTFTGVTVIGTRLDRHGVAQSPVLAPTSAQVVEDLAGRGMLGPIDLDAAIIDDASTVTHDALIFDEGVRGSAVLDRLRETDGAMTWAYGVRRQDGYEFAWSPIPTTARYDVLDVDAVERPGGEREPCHQITVYYTDATGVLQSVTVSSYTDLGERVRDADPITLDGTHTSAEAVTAGREALAAVASPEVHGTVGIDRLIFDRERGHEVEPYMTRPGKCSLPSGELVTINEVEWTREGSRWSIGSQVMDTAAQVQAIVRGDIVPAAPPVKLPPVVRPPVRPVFREQLDARVSAEVAVLNAAIDAIDPTPTVAPTAVTAAISPNKLGFVVMASQADQTTTLDYYHSDGTLIVSTRATTVWVDRDSAGDPFAPDTDYSFYIIARNVAGSASASNTVTARLDPTVDAALVAGLVQAGLVMAGSLEVGPITLNPDTGLTIPGVNGLDTTLGIDGTVVTDRLVAQYLKLRGAFNFVEGRLTLSAGITAPAAPRLGASWSHAAALTQTTFDPAFNQRGLAEYDANNWLVTESFFGTGIWGVGKVGGDRYLLASASDITSDGGAVRVGTDTYVLGKDTATYSKWMVQKYNSSWTKTAEWPVAATVTNQRTLATDGTYLYVAHRRADTGKGYVARYNLDGTGATQYAQTPHVLDGEVTGLYVGNADFGATRVVIATETSIAVIGPASSGDSTRYTTSEWNRVNGRKIRGLAWDGTRFHMLDDSGIIWHFSTVTANTSRSVAVTDRNATYETTPSPATVITQPARWWLKVEMDPPPTDGTSATPDRHRVYIDNQRQADLAAGVNTAIYDSPATGGAAAPTTNGFDAAGTTPGSIQSTGASGGTPHTRLSGDGTVRMVKHSQAGQNNVVLSSAAAGSIAITFPVPFDATPTVTATVNGTTVLMASVTSLTATGCTLNVRHIDGTAVSGTFPVGWIAHTRTA